jgi:hypothetical protein
LEIGNKLQELRRTGPDCFLGDWRLAVIDGVNRFGATRREHPQASLPKFLRFLAALALAEFNSVD